ncbi:hypothetical protein VTK26DRAFT_2970 [Humicola hyalothermophila]
MLSAHSHSATARHGWDGYMQGKVLGAIPDRGLLLTRPSESNEDSLAPLGPFTYSPAGTLSKSGLTHVKGLRTQTPPALPDPKNYLAGRTGIQRDLKTLARQECPSFSLPPLCAPSNFSIDAIPRLYSQTKLPYTMRRLLHSLALLGFCPGATIAQHAGGNGNVGRRYWDTNPLTVTVTSTETVTEVLKMTISTGCPCPSTLSSVSGAPLSTSSSHGPWVNTTSTGSVQNSSSDVPAPSSHNGNSPNITSGIQTSPAHVPTAPGQFSSSFGWNRTTTLGHSASRPMFTGTAGTTSSAVDAIGSSAPWANSTRVSTDHESTVVMTLSVTSSVVTSVGVSETSPWLSGPTAPGSVGHISTGSLGNNFTAGPTSYQPSVTYQTTAPGPSSSDAGLTSASETTLSLSDATSMGSPPPGWSISTVSTEAPTTSTLPGDNGTFPSNSTLNLGSPSSSQTSGSSPIPTVSTTESSEPIFVTTHSTTSLQHTSSTTHGDNSVPSTFPASTPSSISSSSSSTSLGDDDYGSYTYWVPPQPSTTTTTTTTTTTPTVSYVSSVDAVEGTTSTSTGHTLSPPTNISTHTSSSSGANTAFPTTGGSLSTATTTTATSPSPGATTTSTTASTSGPVPSPTSATGSTSAASSGSGSDGNSGVGSSTETPPTTLVTQPKGSSGIASSVAEGVTTTASNSSSIGVPVVTSTTTAAATTSSSGAGGGEDEEYGYGWWRRY